MIFLLTGWEIILIVTGITLFSIAVIVVPIFLVRRHLDNLDVRQDIASDRDILLILNEEPDRMINAEGLAAKTGMTLKEARSRLRHLQFHQVIKVMHASKLKAFYGQKQPVKKVDKVPLSPAPFITIEDLIVLFKEYDYKLTLQDLCIATGLPVKISKREMKYFEKSKVINVFPATGTGAVPMQFYSLREPYKSNPDMLLEKEEEMNLDLEKLYEKVRRDDYV